jgi:hypothetical protein
LGLGMLLAAAALLSFATQSWELLR